jgi:hypothetical protein
MPTNPNVDPWLPTNLSGSTALVAIYPEVWRVAAGFFASPERMLSIQCLSISEHEGVRPSVARFRYAFGNNDPYSPQRIEEALSTLSNVPGAILPSDTLYVLAYRPDGVPEVLFHGHPVGFEATLGGPDSEDAPILAVGVSRRLSDTPIGGPVLRSTATPLGINDAENIEATGLVAVFNPHGVGNCTADAVDYFYQPSGVTDHDRQYPVFIDVNAAEDVDDPNNAGQKIKARTKWTLANAARLLCWRFNGDEELVTNPKGRDLDDLLVTLELDPTNTLATAVDPNDPTTYVTEPIVVPNTPITGRDWLPQLHALIVDRGFASMLRPEFSGSPGDVGGIRTRLDIYRVQTGDVKDLLLQPEGSVLDLTLSNINVLDVTRDVSDAPNEIRVIGAPVRWQADFVLAPGYPRAMPSRTDATDSGTSTGFNRFDSNNDRQDSTRADIDKYRLYVFDENGSGHYAYGSDTLVTGTPTSLDRIFGAPDPQTGVPKYATRARPTTRELISKDGDGRRLRVQLEYSTDYTGPAPALWDATASGTDKGTWTPIDGGYTILKDRLGIRISIDQPNHWKVGSAAKAILHGVEAQANPVAPPVGQTSRFYLRLTAVIEADDAVEGLAERRPNAALPQTITRTVDARDRYFKEVLASGTDFNPATPDPANDSVSRDDTAAALAEAIALRDATDAGVLDGTATVPRITTFYKVGDRLRSIDGRNLGFRTDGGKSTDPAIYPTIVGRSFDFMGQTTTLQISDAQSHRHSYRRATTRRPTSHG